MPISTAESIAIITICAVITFAERLFPFLIFRGGRVPLTIEYLGRMLPVAVMTTLVVYCLRDISFSALGGYLPAVISVMVTAFLHLWRRNTLLSVVGGTASYMLLIRFFAL